MQLPPPRSQKLLMMQPLPDRVIEVLYNTYIAHWSAGVRIRDCDALLVLSSSHVRSAIATTGLYLYLFSMNCTKITRDRTGQPAYKIFSIE